MRTFNRNGYHVVYNLNSIAYSNYLGALVPYKGKIGLSTWRLCHLLSPEVKLTQGPCERCGSSSLPRIPLDMSLPMRSTAIGIQCIARAIRTSVRSRRRSWVLVAGLAFLSPRHKLKLDTGAASSCVLADAQLLSCMAMSEIARQSGLG
jgi:hypothetical protein